MSEIPVLAKMTARIKVVDQHANNKMNEEQGFRIVKCTPIEEIPGVSECEIEILDTPEGRKSLKSLGGQKIPPGISISCE
jgi:hypothetical protein